MKLETEFGKFITLAMILLTTSAHQTWADMVPDHLVRTKLESYPAPQSQCQVTNSQQQNSDKIVVIFEGANGFTKEIEKNFHKVIQANPVCFQYTNNDGSISSKVMIESDIFSAASLQNYFYIQAGIKKFYLDFFCNPKTPNLNTYKPLFFAYDANFQEVYKCLASAKRSLPRAKVMVMGYSYGGDTAIRVANYLSKHGQDIDLGISFDPVPNNKTKMIGLNLLRQTLTKAGLSSSYGKGSPDYDSFAPKEFIAPINTKWLNFWQEDDDRLLITGLRGHGVNNADINMRIEITDEDFLKAPHWYIMYDSKVEENVIQTINDL